MNEEGRRAAHHVRELARRRSAREKDRQYVVDGPVLVAEALRAGVALQSLYVEAGRHPDLVAEAERANVRIHVLPPGGVQRFTDVVTPQGILAVAALPSTGLDAALDAAGRAPVLVLVEVADPGNAGTLVRMAEASGAGAVLFCDGSVDPYAPKCVRASAGSLFHVPVVSGGDPLQVLEAIGGRGVQRLGTAARRGKPYDELDLGAPFALVLGNEAHGLPADVADAVDGWVHIPMAGDLESLNVAMAGSVICFEAARQRRGQGR